MNYSVTVLLIVFLSLFATGALMANEHVEVGNYSVENFTLRMEELMNWNSSKFSSISNENLSAIEIKDNRWVNIIRKLSDFMGYFMFEFGKWSIETGYEHPELDGQGVYDWTRFIIWVIIIVSCIPFIPYLFAFLYLIYEAVKSGAVRFFKKKKK